MKVSEALSLISEQYVPGVVSFYGSQSPDLWQRAHDDLEKVMSLCDHAMNEIAAQRFHDQCIDLIQKFRASNSPSKAVSPVDALNMSDPDRISRYQSVKRKRCIHCGRGEKLKIQNVGKTEIQLVCADDCTGEKKQVNWRYGYEGV
jgi:hypothetical protein